MRVIRQIIALPRRKSHMVWKNAQCIMQSTSHWSASQVFLLQSPRINTNHNHHALLLALNVTPLHYCCAVRGVLVINNSALLSDMEDTEWCLCYIQTFSRGSWLWFLCHPPTLSISRETYLLDGLVNNLLKSPSRCKKIRPKSLE